MILDSLWTSIQQYQICDKSVVYEDWESYCFISNTVVEGAGLSYNGLWMVFQCLLPGGNDILEYLRILLQLQ